MANKLSSFLKQSNQKKTQKGSLSEAKLESQTGAKIEPKFLYRVPLKSGFFSSFAHVSSSLNSNSKIKNLNRKVYELHARVSQRS